MKKNLILLFMLFCITLFLPLYAQESTSDESAEYADPGVYSEPDENINEIRNRARVDTSLDGDQQPEKQDVFGEGFQPERQKINYSHTRQHFEIGFNFDFASHNNSFATGDLFQRNLVIDLNKFKNNVPNSGYSAHLDGGSGFYVDIKNINISEGLWDFGFFMGVDSYANMNIPKSLIILMADGNIKQHFFKGTISTSAAVFTDAGLSGSAQYGKLRLGLKPALFAPLIFIPKSGITYTLDTEKYVKLTTSGEISMYSPLPFSQENDRFSELQTGADVSLEGEYALLSFLDIGGVLSRIPIAPARVQNRMYLTMKKLEFELDVLKGQTTDSPEIDFDEPGYDSAGYNVYRPLRFDAYARFKLLNDSEILVLRPNIGASVDINEGQGYFNAGLELQSTLVDDMIKLHLGTGYEDNAWKHRLGFAFNVRVFEQFAEFTFQSENFAGSLSGYGYGLNLGTRFGW